MSAAHSLHDRLWARFEQLTTPRDAKSVLNVTCAREIERPLTLSPRDTTCVPDSLSRARVTVRTLPTVAPSDRPRWSDLSSTLFWLARRGWPALDVAGVTIEGETAWRCWVSRAQVAELLAVRDRVADAPPTRSLEHPHNASHFVAGGAR